MVSQLLKVGEAKTKISHINEFGKTWLFSHFGTHQRGGASELGLMLGGRSWDAELRLKLSLRG